jgi:hypothetical protein
MLLRLLQNLLFSKNLVVLKIVKSASFVTDGRDGYIMYTTTSGDINEKGLWKIQGQVAFGPNVLNSSTVGTLKYMQIYKGYFYGLG